jgi:hypothetical protein
MEELLIELKILKDIMADSAKVLKFRLDNTDSEVKVDTSFLDEEITFGSLLFALTRTLSHADLLNMSDKDMLKHIQKIQVIEKE